MKIKIKNSYTHKLSEYRYCLPICFLLCCFASMAALWSKVRSFLVKHFPLKEEEVAE